MAAKYKIGEKVIHVVPTAIQGTISDRAIAGDDDIFLVNWIDENGDAMSRWFKEDEIQLV